MNVFSICQLKNEMKIKESPSSQIGGALVDGLFAFEELVEHLEELCLAAVPPELREECPLDESGEISFTWRACLVPGLNQLQKEAEEAKGR